MNSTSKKRLIMVLILSFAIMLSAIILGAFIFNRNIFLQQKEQGKVNVDFGDFNNLIHIDNSLPIGDEMGKTLDGEGTKEGIQGYLEFAIKEEKGQEAKFEIYLEKRNVETQINSNYVKLYLTDMNDSALEGFDRNIIPTFKSLKVADDNPSHKILYRGKIEKFGEKKYKLRVWLSDSSAMEIEKKTFEMILGVRVY